MNNQNNQQVAQSLNKDCTANGSSDSNNSNSASNKRRNAICVTLQDANGNLMNNMNSNSTRHDKQ